jgi:hypothetical protein
MSAGSGILEEAYERFHVTGPEFDDGLSNHGPMAVEAMVRRGHDAEVHAWIDWYRGRLEDRPRGITPVTREDWREALGDTTRLGDWTTFMLRESRERPWRELLVEWWPRLLPGIIAGATHGVIRVGHSVRALLAEESALPAAASPTAPAASTGATASAITRTTESTTASTIAAITPEVAVTDGPRLAEFAHALAYWAARWKPLDGGVADVPRTGLRAPAQALAEIPGVPEQAVGVSHRVSQLSDTPGWREALATLRTPATARQTSELLEGIVDAAVFDYLVHGHANPVMLVHASTAPTAVLRTLPVLPEAFWVPSLDAAWLATAAVTAAYRNTAADDEAIAAATAQTGGAQESFDRAVRHRDEHAVKFADTALDVFERTNDPRALAAVTRSTMMIKEA